MKEKSIRSTRFPAALRFAVDAYVLVFFPSRADKTHSFYRGPYKIIAVDTFEFHYLVAPLELNGTFGPTISVHSRRFLPYNFTRSSASLEAARVLPAGELVVDDIVSHRSLDGGVGLEFEVRWLGFAATSFLLPSELSRLPQFIAFITRHKIKGAALRQITRERAAARAAK